MQSEIAKPKQKGTENMERIIIIALILLWFSVTFIIGVLMENVSARLKSRKNNISNARTGTNMMPAPAAEGGVSAGLSRRDKLSLDRNDFLCYNHSNI